MAVILKLLGAVWAVLLEARASLSADTDTVTLFNVLDVLSNLDGLANDFVADDTCLDGC